MAKKTNLQYLTEQLEENNLDPEWLDGLISDHESELDELKGEKETLNDEISELQNEFDEFKETAPDFETLQTPLGIFQYVMPGNLKMDQMVEDFIEKLKNI